MAEARDGWAGTIKGRPEVGQAAERSRQTRSADIEAFTAITGDRNPLHYDAALAEASVFGRIIVQGGVTSGLLNALVAEDLPGPGTVFLAVEWKFRKAVGIGETAHRPRRGADGAPRQADLHPRHLDRRRRRRGLPRGNRDHLHRAARAGSRLSETERGAKPRAVVGEHDLGAVHAGDGGDQREAEPGAGTAAARVEPHEPPQRPGAVGLGNAGAVVGDAELRPAGLDPGADGDGAARRRELQRVVDEVRERERQQLVVPLDRQSRRGLAGERQPALLGGGLVELGDVRGEAARGRPR